MADPTPADRTSIRHVPPLPFPDRERPEPRLPVTLTSFVGRQREVAGMVALLRRLGVRLVTLAGPGGVGKTRLAIRVAEEVADAFPGGVWFVELAPVRDPALVTATVAQTLGLRESGSRTAEEGVREFLRDRRALLVLDNLEHLPDAGLWLPALLAACPDIAILATSRAVLHVSGEHTVAVAPLALPDLDHLPPVAALTGVEAVRLFVERARAASADFALTEQNGPVVAAICARLDGLPLAIELAAARSDALAPAALLARLERRLPLLIGGPRDVPARLRTMRDAIAWSHDLLAPAEQALFRRLGGFVGGFALEEAEEVAIGAEASSTGERSADVFEGVASLLGKSLLRQGAGPGGEPRYQMLETIREYAGEQLQASGEDAAVARVHAAHFLALAERGETALHGPRQAATLARLADDLGNLRAALAWFLGRGDATAGLRLGGALWGFWNLRGHLGEGRRWLEAALALGGSVPVAVRAKALQAAGHLAQNQGDTTRATDAIGQSLALYRELGDTVRTGNALLLLGIMAVDRGDYDAAAALFAEARAAIEEARLAAEEAHDASALGEALYLVAAVNLHSGVVAYGRGDLDLAAAHYEEALGVARAEAHSELVASLLRYRGLVDRDRGDLARAVASLREALTLDAANGDRGGIAHVFANLAVLAAITGQPERAAQLLGAADGLWERVGFLRSALSKRFPSERARDAALTALGEAAFVEAWAAGRALPLDEALAVASAVAVPDAPVGATAPRRAAPGAEALTARECDVLRLLVEGGSDKEIAAALGLTRRSASKHVAAILAKLAVPSRTAAATLAVRNRLV